MWQNIVEPERQQTMRIACRKIKATKYIHTCNTYCCPTSTMVAATCLNVTCIRRGKQSGWHH